MILSRSFRSVGQECFVKRYMSISHFESARELLGLDANANVTARVLRQSYLKAAMRCHPDLQQNKDSDEFRKVTAAYEFLRSGVNPDQDLGITGQEDNEFRQACQDWLGLPGEVVEETKRCPMFRTWLDGKTDAAFRWRLFFALHGGLAPMLRPPSALLEDQSEAVPSLDRRKRK